MNLAEIHSTGITEDGAELSVWLMLADGSLIAVYLPLAELIERGHTIEDAPAGQAAGLVLARIARQSRAH